MNKIIYYSLSILLIIGLSGCTRILKYTPNDSTFKMDPIQEFSSNNSVSLINGQESTNDVEFASKGIAKFTGNLQEWTNIAIQITKRELSKRNMIVTVEDPSKKLKLSIETVKGTFGAWVVRTEIRLTVETGDGYKNSYIGDNRSPASLNRASDGAVMRAVASMLNDPNIISYLKE
uniref:hypothetical protein n=1 Tax=Aliarcobacter sp. TaxID=2321116 RepID=UPI004048AA44